MPRHQLSWLSRLWLLPLVLLTSCTPSVFTSAASLLPLLIGLGQLRSQLDAVTNTLNGAAADRTHQLSVEADQRIKQVQELVNKSGDRIDLTETHLMSDVADLTARVDQEVSDKGYISYLALNDSLVNVSRLMNGIPLVNVKPYLFAISPYRILPHAQDRLIVFHGYFPDATADHPLKVVIGKQTFSLHEYTGNSYAFEMPADLLKETTFINMAVKIPVRRLHFFYGSHQVNGRVYVETERPFHITVRQYKENPELWPTVNPSHPYFASANNSSTSVIRTLSAKDLFSTLVGDNVTYDLDTASFLSMNANLTHGPPPCHCCDSPSSRLDRWDAGSVAFSLSAPTCGDHWCAVFDHCGGGGTNAEIYLQPAFRVKRRGVPETVLESQQTMVLLRKSINSGLDINQDWATVEIDTLFLDGDERREDSRTLTSGVPIVTADLWKANINNGMLHLETR